MRAHLGHAQYQHGLFHEAIRNLSYAISISATPANALFCRAVCKEHIGDMDGAIEDYRGCLAIKEDAEAISRMAAIFEYKGEIESAKGLYQRALTIDPDEPMALAALEELKGKPMRH